MILDYITPNGNYDGLFSSGGLRIYHVDATLANDEYVTPYLTADNYSPVYDSTNNGRRILDWSITEMAFTGTVTWSEALPQALAGMTTTDSWPLWYRVYDHGRLRIWGSEKLYHNDFDK